MSKSKNRFYAEIKAQTVMDQLRKEIPAFHLDELFMTIRDDSHKTTMTWEAFIVMRYTDLIEELIETIDKLLSAGDGLVKCLQSIPRYRQED